MLNALQEEEVKPEDIYASVDSREVKISAVFLKLMLPETKEVGVDWKVLLSQNGFKFRI
ncbi:MAG: hypothetical protein MZV64_57955 [Ignavibacteriales bacterium]|nr:hypothetical protein [Ignavibacteriales bacterium]